MKRSYIAKMVYLYTLWNLALTIIVLALIYIVTRFYYINRHILAWAKAFASQMGTKGGEARAMQKRQRIRAESKGKVLDAITQEVPYGKAIVERLRDSGMKDDELWVLVTDPDVLRGLKVFADTIGSVIGGVKKLSQPKSGRGVEMPLAREMR